MEADISIMYIDTSIIKTNGGIVENDTSRM